MLACFSVTLSMRGITVWSHRWAWLAGAGMVAVALLTSACQVTPAAVAAQATGTAQATVAAQATGVASVAVAAASAVGGPVVALGDSYTAGAQLPLDPHAQPPGCLRSAKAYPVLVAAALGAQLTDVACANAGVNQMTGAQKTYLGTNPPQLNALTSDDRLVLLTLSGDDMGFMNVLQTCVKLSFTDPWGSPCKAYYTKGGTDQLAARIKAEAPRMAQVLQAIAARAPRARIVLVGYLDLFPQSGGCWPAVPITDGDIAYLRGIEVKVNAMLAADAKTAGATFVDTYTPTIGHDFCQPESVRDVEGLLPGSPALPFHPNARGQAAVAAAVLQALRP
jgi:lysophospholipase L1-like esterase